MVHLLSHFYEVSLSTYSWYVAQNLGPTIELLFRIRGDSGIRDRGSIVVEAAGSGRKAGAANGLSAVSREEEELDSSGMKCFKRQKLEQRKLARNVAVLMIR